MESECLKPSTMKRVLGISLEWGRDAGGGLMGWVGGDCGGSERLERAVRWRAVEDMVLGCGDLAADI